MRLTLAKAFLLVAIGLVGFGLFARFKAVRLEAEVAELGARSREAGTAFVTSLAAEHQVSELQLLDQRREKALHAAWLGRGGLFSFGLAVLSLLAAWVAHELASFARFTVEVEDPRRPPGRPGELG